MEDSKEDSPSSSFDAMDVCIPERMLKLEGSELENLFFTSIFPPLCAIGIIGNLLNLTVLLSGEIRSRRTTNHRSNGLLVALALCDILFLILMIPHSMANFDRFGLNHTFRVFYFSFKTHLISMANWCSAVTIWLVIAICAERLLGIRSLLRANSQWSPCTTARLISTIILATGVLTFYNHFSYHCVVKELCNGTQVISKCFDIVQEDWPGNRTNFTPPALRAYVQWSIILNVAFVIILPIIVMLGLNCALLVVVRRQSFLMYNRLMVEQHHKDSVNMHPRHKSSLPSIVTAKRDSEDMGSYVTSMLFRRSIDQTAQFHAEHRVTVTVCAIVTCFTITQGPSAIVMSLSFLSGHRPPYVNSNITWYNISTFTGFLVIIGKTLNFVLFCLSSAAFRRRLLNILNKKFVILSRRSSMQATSTTTAGTSQSSLRKNGAQPGTPQQTTADRRYSLAF
ncbi:unnamed protein product [Bursaphelenchus okinawaensis]|uniref:G-protein coupled receptors family 1 profile domain-containing protein n=1 Tax=Bursaphelenchus okinawaensis TaxID=465554 RepID=A0A811KDY4_9BILA|nr:unnamed protein product [Bursaphelenchus okinawaensis]CAG9101822.1 unnamed protein product [Bursaphelenchus okinawaensis]